MKIGCPGIHCSLIPTSYSAHAKNRPWYLPEKIDFPGGCVRVCRPYDSCMSFGNNYYYYYYYNYYYYYYYHYYYYYYCYYYYY